MIKELRLFFRDTTQWSQLILLGVLVVVYVFNIKYLPLHGDGMTFFLINIVPFLNLVLGGIRARVDRRAIHLPGREPGGPHALAAAVEPDGRCAICCGRSSGWARCPLLVLALGIVARDRLPAAR